MISNNKKKLIQQLTTKKQRDMQGRFIAEGIKLVGDLLRGGLKTTYIVGYAEALKEINAEKWCRDIADCNEAEMKGISQLKTPSPILAIFEKPASAEIDDCPQDLTLILDEIQDPGNMGTIIRVADWFGIRKIVCSKTCADIYNPKVIQATMGAIARVRVVETDLECYLEYNATHWHIPVYGTFLEGSNIYTCQLQQRAFIIMGNEGKGINDKLTKYVSDKLFIPNFPAGEITSESLNVATATAITVSEFRRPR